MPYKPKRRIRHQNDPRGAGLLSNYGGPGGVGRVLHPSDALFKKHDEDYGRYQLEKHRPYVEHNQADSNLIEGLRRRRQEGGLSLRESTINYAADAFFTAKNALPLPNIPTQGEAKSQRDMEDASMEPTVAAATMATTTSQSLPGTHETPVTKARPTYGLENTHTAILPYDQYFSIFDTANHTKRVPGHIIFSLTNPLQPMVSAITHVYEIGAGSSGAIASGVYDRPVRPWITSWATDTGIFPQQYSDLAKPQWWNYWSKIYEVYHVVGVSWRLVVENEGVRGHDDIMLAYGVDSYTASDTTNKFPVAPKYEDIVRWEQAVQLRMIEGTAQGGPEYDQAAPVMEAHPEIIEGHYIPYQKNHIVMNDADEKTWFYTNVAPTLKEDMHFFVYTAPLSTNEGIRCNCKLEMKWIIQFKDLKNQFRFPVDTEASPISVTNITDTTELTKSHDGGA